MFSIFKPVFESVWKRKETKIFLSFAFLFPTLFLASTFLPKGSNFMVPHASEGYLFSFMTICGVMVKAATDFTLPILALFYLTFTVFKGEADSHTMFLYKDINRKHIFWAKWLSLVSIVLLYNLALCLILFVYYFVRIGHMDYAVLTVLDHLDPSANLYFVHTLVANCFDMIVCVSLAACVSLYSGVGLTMTLAFAYSIGTSILSIFGFAYLFPAGSSDPLDEGASLVATLGPSLIVTVFYAGLLIYATLKYFKKMEY